MNKLFKKEEPPIPYDPKNPNIQANPFSSVLDSFKFAFEIGKEISAKNAKSDEQILQMIQRQAMLGLHEFK